MESSRIFIRGLPPSLSVEDFRKHFSKHSPITDAKFIPHRRIGYVGYRTSEDAARAVKYHNKSFIRMSKIAVELARSVEEQLALKPRWNGGNVGHGHQEKTVDGTTPSLGQRERKSSEPDGGDAKLQEFLQVMQPPSKSKTWQNQDAPAISTMVEPALETKTKHLMDVAETKSDEEYEPVPKKQKKSKTENQEPAIKYNSEPEAAIAEKDEQDKFMQDREGDVPEPVTEAPTASDTDWLRSRTSRLLGLVDDDDAMATPAPRQDEEIPKPLDHTLPTGSEAKNNLDAGAQTDEEAQQAEPAVPATSSDDIQASPASNGRIFVRNLTYTTTEDDLHNHFEGRDYGTIEEVHLPVDSRSGNNKGFAHIRFTDPDAATRALEDLDRKPFQGRLLHILPSNSKKQNGLDEFAISKLPLKKQQQIKRKAEAASSTFNWNSMYMNSDAVISSISDRLGVAKSELLDPSSSNAAIKQALAETHIIQQTRSYFTANGVDLDAFKRRERGDTAILVKNFPYGTTTEELKKLFEAHGRVTKLLMPPSGTIAIVGFEQADHARSAFGSLAYRKFNDSILFLEKAPKDVLSHDGNRASDAKATGHNRVAESKVTDENITNAKGLKSSATELLETNHGPDPVNTSTLFVRNLNFSTTTDRLREIFQPLDGFLSARVKTRADPKKPGQLLSMGFGFLEFRSTLQAQAALAAMDGYRLDGHGLLIRASHRVVDAAQERRKEDHAKKVAGRKTKIIIKNLPFEAERKDVRTLFGSYGQLRSVRVPKKFDSSTRGFAFADFVTAREAENAMDALKDTHLLGRRLVLEFAAEDAIDPELEIEKMQHKVGRQADRVALQRLTGPGRKKFNVERDDELESLG